MKKAISQPSEAKISHIFGIDYGAARVGLALADLETKIAFVYGTLENNRNFLQKLVEIIEKEDVRTVVIGIPSYINREEVEYAGEKLGKIIKKTLPGISVEYQNEMFTTKMAQNNLIERGVKGVKKHDDEEAARIILQSWLDKSRNT
jgi:putative Holliday junction resolvase